MQIAADLMAAPVLVVLSSLAARRWGARVGGIVSAFPAVVGPVLLIVAHEHGAEFAASAANGTLLGLAALAGFAVAYARTAARTDWPVSLAAGWGAAALAGAAASAVDAGSPAGVVVASGSLAAAYLALPSCAAAAPTGLRMPGLELPLRAGATLALVAALAALAGV